MRHGVRRVGGIALMLCALAGAGSVKAQTAHLSEPSFMEQGATREATSDSVTTKAETPSPKTGSSEPVYSGQMLAKGLASWYANRFHGRRTASGERYDKNALTAAHKTLPFGTLVRVKNVRSGKEVVVRINDRGPYAHKRLIDLSGAAAAALGIKSHGVASVVLLRE